MNKIKVVYLSTSVTWGELLDWNKEVDIGPIYYMEKISKPTSLNSPVVSLYAWSDSNDIVNKFLSERNPELFTVKTMKLTDEEFHDFKEDYSQFFLREYEMPIEDEQGALITTPDIETVKIVATRLESAFLTDSTDTIQFLESFLTKSADYYYEIFTNPLADNLGYLSYFNYAARNIEGMFQSVEVWNNDEISNDDDKDMLSMNLTEEGITASQNGYDIVNGTSIAFRDTTEVKIYYLRLFKFAFWYTYIDTVPDYSAVYH